MDRLLRDAPPFATAQDVSDGRSELLRQIEILKADREACRESLVEARKLANARERVLLRIREYTGPFFKLLTAIHGELDGANISEDTAIGHPPGESQPPSREKWQAWKNQLPPSCGKVIDALLVQPLTTTQLKGICKVSYESARQAIVILTRNGLIEKDGDMNRLKRL